MHAIYLTSDKIISKISLLVIDFEKYIYIKGHCIGLSSDYCILIKNDYIIGSKILGKYDFYILKDSEKEIEGFNINEIDNIIETIKPYIII